MDKEAKLAEAVKKAAAVVDGLTSLVDSVSAVATTVTQLKEENLQLRSQVRALEFQLRDNPAAVCLPYFPLQRAGIPLTEQGLVDKYHVTRTDGSDQIGQRNYGQRYFVLAIDKDPHAISALAAYAAACRGTHPLLADDLDALLTTKKGN